MIAGNLSSSFPSYVEPLTLPLDYGRMAIFANIYSLRTHNNHLS